jgi:hypothetical protein
MTIVRNAATDGERVKPVHGGPRMTVMKAVVRGILIASVCASASSTRAGSILTLGVIPDNPGASQVATNPSTVFESFNQTNPAPTLRLGVTSNSSPLAFSPVQTAPAVAFPAEANPSPIPPPPPPPLAIAPVSIPPLASAVSAPTTQYDAFINMGSGPYASSANMTTGTPQPWYLSGPVDRFFGGVPTLQQQLGFDNTVLQRVQQTFALSGVPVSLTLDPNAPAAHSISVVSQTTNPTLNSVIGMTYIGGNGFHYIDNSASDAHSLDQLEWIVAHNVAHELMLAFGVPETHDATGQFIDARNASWSMITSPTATFSPGAVADLLSRNFQAANGSVLNSGAQLLGPPTVPEPSTVVLWAVIAAAGLVANRARRQLRPE